MEAERAIPFDSTTSIYPALIDLSQMQYLIATCQSLWRRIFWGNMEGYY